ncbi:MAG: bifunctional folylpolyglutamate synthase/dihydrofolate synthase [Methanomassiliicoccaceae archaeon]|jgi:dihydrofolate synthase/folylpolyglutamate synthase|nr:bifunctional folylpolyglutamate synthase/dihydrofolate synthase [Methanomassiliicoccaceae archaeon]
MNFSEWVYGLGMNRMRFGLDNITELLRRLGDPQKRFKTVHVAGSDGKGSTSAMIYSILLKANIKAGLYTSPHLMRFNERISVCGEDIEDDELAHLMGIVRPVVDQMLSEGTDCTFFEVTTALAFLHFSLKGVKYAVLETGLGGRLDATNTVIPEVTAITNISLEHTDILGDTVEKIAFEKAGIIKNGVPVITANVGSTLDVIKRVAAEKGAELIAVDRNDVKIISFTGGFVKMEYSGNEYDVGIPGSCQAENAAVAAECVMHLRTDVSGYIKKGLKEVIWHGRMEHFPDENIIIDVSHTAAGAERLAGDVMETYGKVTLVLGMFIDKDADQICRSLSKISSNIVITAPSSERAMPPERLAEIMKKYSCDVSVKEDLREAIDSVRGKGTVLITGSLHMAGEAMSYLRK